VAHTTPRWRSERGSSSGPRPGLIPVDSPGTGHRALPGEREQSLCHRWGRRADHEWCFGHAYRHGLEGRQRFRGREEHAARASQEGDPDSNPEIHADGNAGADADAIDPADHLAEPAADLPKPDSNTRADADTGADTDAHRGANPDTDGGANADTSANPDADPGANSDADPRADTHARPDADTAAGRHPGDAGDQLIVRADSLDLAGQRRPRPDFPQRTPDR